MRTNRFVLAVFIGLLFAANVAVGQQQLPLFPKYGEWFHRFRRFSCSKRGLECRNNWAVCRF